MLAVEASAAGGESLEEQAASRWLGLSGQSWLWLVQIEDSAQDPGTGQRNWRLGHYLSSAVALKKLVQAEVHGVEQLLGDQHWRTLQPHFQACHFGHFLLEARVAIQTLDFHPVVPLPSVPPSLFEVGQVLGLVMKY